MPAPLATTALNPDTGRMNPPFRAALLLPRHWLSWLLIGVMWTASLLPISWLLAFGSWLGRTLGRIARRRRHIVLVNLRLCFPELSAAEHERLTDEHFAALGAGVFEAALAWFASDARLFPRFEIRGREHLDAAVASGQGLLLLTGHFTALEIGARVVCSMAGLPFHAMYRPYSNELLDFFMHRWRGRRSGLPALPREDLRRLVRVLREGRAIWYAPDQTLDPRASVFAPFFGVMTPSLTATARLAHLGRARVLPYFPERIGGRWRVTFFPMLEDFPGGDEVADATRINQVIEAGIRQALPQYFWTHRKFKTRPPGEPKLY